MGNLQRDGGGIRRSQVSLDLLKLCRLLTGPEWETGPASRVDSVLYPSHSSVFAVHYFRGSCKVKVVKSKSQQALLKFGQFYYI